MPQTQADDFTEKHSLSDPEKDRLGYATFAKYLADSICNMTITEGFVIAVYGSWNSGKSTLMNFLIHYLQEKPEDERPIIVPFNPLLFSGSQDITKRFFEQIRNVISRISSVSKGLKERIGDFAKAVGQTSLPYSQAGTALATLFEAQEKETPELKEEVEEKLVNQDKRIVVAIDDIDRLSTEEIQQLFRLLKAIPSFTNIIYVLAFNKEVVLKALTETKQTSEAYLDQIIQVDFELPKPDKTSLRRIFFEKLNNVIFDLSEELFVSNYWRNIYYEGIDHFITSLRDIVRLIENLSLTYPTVKGEVNPIDYIALESLRVFCPIIYDTIRNNKNAFLGKQNSSIDEIKNILNSWTAQLKNEDKQPVQKILMFLFPKLSVVWGSKYSYVEETELEWCNKLRICCPEKFSIYFRLALGESKLFQTQIDAIFALSSDEKTFAQKLTELANQKRPDGTTQLRAFLEELENYTGQEIPQESIPGIVKAFLEVGEQLLIPEDEPTTIFDFSNEVRISHIISQLLSRLDEPTRFQILETSVSEGEVISRILNEIKISLKDEFLLSAQHLKELEGMIAQKQHQKCSPDNGDNSGTDINSVG
ncbi:P-loop NTPase fold protein [Aetokthonos hydrillicola Thurmond2011]|uniref:P-loop NTPase fold protein n=2 Tax=Aetokthonos TaxID=1550243 RepID=A0AAP5M9E7_9CYAN|nr:P-loop NTPase fold protein [Aetokthonos hydrillicola]MBO3463517.1 AAA family ATPase [Aetokthonos hydrillicola CCALA 1050]MBW4584937.1 AAA family ATPase [Aetokthonos hydrillicola CCALA 1050]MDR9894304.1 P-loop NTPase fold protein [Aetokthonos hydrillicola Thurmond2011]